MDFRTDAELKSDLESAGNTWQLWVDKAQDLVAASGYLTNLCPFKKNLGKDNVAFLQARGSVEDKASRAAPMLLAMAAECFLKALWLKSGKQLIENGSYRKIPGTNDHQLDTLALALHKSCSITFSDEEIGLLFRLSDSITSGRYPIPKNTNKRKLISTDGKTVDIEMGTWRRPADDELADSFFHRIWEMFTEN